jgi:hypothetical protein
MSGTYTAEGVRQEHVNCMGQDLGLLYHALWNELAWVESKWVEYVELYGTNESRIDLLNQAAGHFFKIVQDSLWDDTLLHIARLTDPAKSMGKENLSIKKLPLSISDDSLRKKVSELIGLADTKTDFCRDRRNRRIAHRDFRLAMKTGAEPLLPASRSMVREALNSLADVLNAVSCHYLDSTTEYEHAISSNGAAQLLYVIDDGLRESEKRNSRIRNGEYLPEDLEIRDL